MVRGSKSSCVYDVTGALPDGTFKYVYGLGIAYAVDGSGNMQVYHTDGLGPGDHQQFSGDEHPAAWVHRNAGGPEWAGLFAGTARRPGDF